MQIKKNIGYFEYSLLVTRIHYISLKLQHFSFFESQSDEGRIQLAIKLFGISKRSRIVSTNYFLFIFLDNISHIFWDQPPIINVVCKYQRLCRGTSFGVATLLVCCNVEWEIEVWLISEKWTIPEFPEIFPWIAFVSIICVKYCRRSNYKLNYHNYSHVETWIQKHLFYILKSENDWKHTLKNMNLHLIELI